MIFPTISSWKLHLQKQKLISEKKYSCNCHLKYNIPNNTILKMGYIYIFPVAIRDVWKTELGDFVGWFCPQIRISGTTCVNTSRRVELSSRLMRKIRFFFWNPKDGLFIQVGCSIFSFHETSRHWSKLFVDLETAARYDVLRCAGYDASCLF